MLDKIGIVAGGGELPSRLIEACRKKSREVFVVAIKGHAEKASVAEMPHAWVQLGAPGRAIELMRAQHVGSVVFAGHVRRPRNLEDIYRIGIPDGLAIRFLLKERGAIFRDDGFLRAVARWAEQLGLRVVGAETIDGTLLAAEGVYGSIVPDEAAERDIAHGITAAQTIGRRDQGQGAVVQQGVILALETIDGTDAMIARAGRLRRRSAPGGVLVKVKKPGQEARIDLPTIGVSTVKNAEAAGLRGIAIEAGAALVIDREAVAAAADAAGLFVVGIKASKAVGGLAKACADPAQESGSKAQPVPGPLAEGPLIFLMAGEPSGDALGARLMDALKRETNGMVRFAGIGGERMTAEGLVSQFPMEELSVMGLAEVLPRAPRILRRVRETVEHIQDLRPSAIVSIDATGFCFRVEKRVKANKVVEAPFIHYVAPMVWAWRPWKARVVAKFLDHLMTLLPFEPPYFEKEGLPATFVGHPVLEEGADKGDGPGFRARFGIPADVPLLAVLPGSRRAETSRLLPVFAETLHHLKKEFPALHVVIATVETVAENVAQAAARWPVPAVVVRGLAEKYDAFAAADAALAASGTVSLELALAKCPMVIAYKVSPVTAFLLRHFLARIRFASLINLVMDRAVVPEMLQERCRPVLLAEHIGRLLRDPEARRRQLDGCAAALARLRSEGPAPSIRAARTVLGIIAKRTNPPPVS